MHFLDEGREFLLILQILYYILHIIFTGKIQVINFKCSFVFPDILEYHRKETKLEPIPSEEIEEEEEYTPDLRLGIKRIANDYSVSFGRGGLPAMNDTLVGMLTADLIKI